MWLYTWINSSREVFLFLSEMSYFSLQVKWARGNQFCVCHAQLIKQSTCMSKTHKTDAENILGELTKNSRQFFQCQCYLCHAEVDKRFILFGSLWFWHLALNVFSSLVYSASKTLIVIGWGDLSSLMVWNTIEKLFFKSKYIVFIFIKLFQR